MSTLSGAGMAGGTTQLNEIVISYELRPSQRTGTTDDSRNAPLGWTKANHGHRTDGEEHTAPKFPIVSRAAALGHVNNEVRPARWRHRRWPSDAPREAMATYFAVAGLRDIEHC